MIKRILLIAVPGLMLAACGQEDAPDFCDNHALFHAEHAGSNAVLQVTMKDGGSVESELRYPTAAFNAEAVMSLLQDSSNVYQLQTTAACGDTEATVSSNADNVFATYTSDCGVDNQLKQVDVALFDALPDLDEIEVTVVTPVTQKHFLINRQCAAAIFRFE